MQTIGNILSARLISPTYDRHTEQPNFHPPFQPGHSVVGAAVTSMQCIRCYLTANTHYNPGTLILECNGVLVCGAHSLERTQVTPLYLSKNLIPLAHSSWKPLPAPFVNRGQWELSPRQPSRHC